MADIKTKIKIERYGTNWFESKEEIIEEIERPGVKMLYLKDVIDAFPPLDVIKKIVYGKDKELLDTAIRNLRAKLPGITDKQVYGILTCFSSDSAYDTGKQPNNSKLMNKEQLMDAYQDFGYTFKLFKHKSQDKEYQYVVIYNEKKERIVIIKLDVKDAVICKPKNAEGKT